MVKVLSKVKYGINTGFRHGFKNVIFSKFFFGFIASLSMIISSHDKAGRIKDNLDARFNEQEDTFDFIVVGGGSAGSLVANRLSEGHKVLLLEAGGEPHPLQRIPGMAFFMLNYKETDWMHRTVPQRRACFSSPNRRASWSQGRNLGGSSNLNFLVHLRGSPRDYDNWAKITGDDTWSYAGVLPYFRRHENYQGDSPDREAHGFDGELKLEVPSYTGMAKEFIRAGQELGYEHVDLNARYEEGFDTIYYPLEGGERRSSFAAFLDPIRERETLVIRKYAHVNKILIRGYDSSAYGVEYDRHGRRRYAYATKEVILAAGTVETAKLLMLSGIGPKTHLADLGIPIVADLPVGKNLQDHLSTFLGPFFIDPPRSYLIDRDITLKSFYEYKSDGNGPLSTSLFQAAALISSKKVKHSGSWNWPDIQLLMSGLAGHKTFAKDLAHAFHLNPKLIKKYYEPALGRDSFFISVSASRPQARGEIVLEKKDPYAPMSINPHYLENEHDLGIMIEGIKTALYLVENTTSFQNLRARFTSKKFPGCEHMAFRSDDYFECYVRHFSVSMNDFVGTCAMGEPNMGRDGVLDSQLKVIGVDHLRVVDASVMPTIVGSGTEAAVLMIAEKGADIVMEAWRTREVNEDSGHGHGNHGHGQGNGGQHGHGPPPWMPHNLENFNQRPRPDNAYGVPNQPPSGQYGQSVPINMNGDDGWRNGPVQEFNQNNNHNNHNQNYWPPSTSEVPPPFDVTFVQSPYPNEQQNNQNNNQNNQNNNQNNNFNNQFNFNNDQNNNYGPPTESTLKQPLPQQMDPRLNINTQPTERDNEITTTTDSSLNLMTPSTPNEENPPWPTDFDIDHLAESSTNNPTTLDHTASQFLEELTSLPTTSSKPTRFDTFDPLPLDMDNSNNTNPISRYETTTSSSSVSIVSATRPEVTLLTHDTKMRPGVQVSNPYPDHHYQPLGYESGNEFTTVSTTSTSSSTSKDNFRHKYPITSSIEYPNKIPTPPELGPVYFRNPEYTTRQPILFGNATGDSIVEGSPGYNITNLALARTTTMKEYGHNPYNENFEGNRPQADGDLKDLNPYVVFKSQGISNKVPSTANVPNIYYKMKDEQSLDALESSRVTQVTINNLGRPAETPSPYWVNPSTTQGTETPTRDKFTKKPTENPYWVNNSPGGEKTPENSTPWTPIIPGEKKHSGRVVRIKSGNIGVSFSTTPVPMAGTDDFNSDFENFKSPSQNKIKIKIKHKNNPLNAQKNQENQEIQPYFSQTKNINNFNEFDAKPTVKPAKRPISMTSITIQRPRVRSKSKGQRGAKQVPFSFQGQNFPVTITPRPLLSVTIWPDEMDKHYAGQDNNDFKGTEGPLRIKTPSTTPSPSPRPTFKDKSVSGGSSGLRSNSFDRFNDFDALKKNNSRGKSTLKDYKDSDTSSTILLSAFAEAALDVLEGKENDGDNVQSGNSANSGLSGNSASANNFHAGNSDNSPFFEVGDDVGFGTALDSPSNLNNDQLYTQNNQEPYISPTIQPPLPYEQPPNKLVTQPPEVEFFAQDNPSTFIRPPFHIDQNDPNTFHHDQVNDANANNPIEHRPPWTPSLKLSLKPQGQGQGQGQGQFSNLIRNRYNKNNLNLGSDPTRFPLSFKEVPQFEVTTPLSSPAFDESPLTFGDNSTPFGSPQVSTTVRPRQRQRQRRPGNRNRFRNNNDNFAQNSVASSTTHRPVLHQQGHGNHGNLNDFREFNHNPFRGNENHFNFNDQNLNNQNNQNFHSGNSQNFDVNQNNFNGQNQQQFAQNSQNTGNNGNLGQIPEYFNSNENNNGHFVSSTPAPQQIQVSEQYPEFLETFNTPGGIETEAKKNTNVDNIRLNNQEQNVNVNNLNTNSQFHREIPQNHQQNFENSQNFQNDQNSGNSQNFQNDQNQNFNQNQNQNFPQQFPQHFAEPPPEENFHLDPQNLQVQTAHFQSSTNANNNEFDTTTNSNLGQNSEAFNNNNFNQNQNEGHFLSGNNNQGQNLEQNLNHQNFDNSQNSQNFDRLPEYLGENQPSKSGVDTGQVSLTYDDTGSTSVLDPPVHTDPDQDPTNSVQQNQDNRNINIAQISLTNDHNDHHHHHQQNDQGFHNSDHNQNSGHNSNQNFDPNQNFHPQNPQRFHSTPQPQHFEHSSPQPHHKNDHNPQESSTNHEHRHFDGLLTDTGIPPQIQVNVSPSPSSTPRPFFHSTFSPSPSPSPTQFTQNHFSLSTTGRPIIFGSRLNNIKNRDPFASFGDSYTTEPDVIYDHNVDFDQNIQGQGQGQDFLGQGPTTPSGQDFPQFFGSTPAPQHFQNSEVPNQNFDYQSFQNFNPSTASPLHFSQSPGSGLGPTTQKPREYTIYSDPDSVDLTQSDLGQGQENPGNHLTRRADILQQRRKKRRRNFFRRRPYEEDIEEDEERPFRRRNRRPHSRRRYRDQVENYPFRRRSAMVDDDDSSSIEVKGSNLTQNSTDSNSVSTKTLSPLSTKTQSTTPVPKRISSININKNLRNNGNKIRNLYLSTASTTTTKAARIELKNLKAIRSFGRVQQASPSPMAPSQSTILPRKIAQLTINETSSTNSNPNTNLAIN